MGLVGWAVVWKCCTDDCRGIDGDREVRVIYFENFTDGTVQIPRDFYCTRHPSPSMMYRSWTVERVTAKDEAPPA